MKVTGTLTLLCCLLLLLPAEGQRRHYRGRSNRGRNPGRALRRLATAGLLFGAGTAVGVALARGKRDVSFDDANLGLAEEAVLEAVQAADSDRCMEQWLCDITARPEQQRADEEQDYGAAV
ncbi:hypothetical protein FJT64_020719 [Amphibalanus amphitrite]|uniref:Uncharacterized protein n=1 Tax=Amphibalanus amphitrite TaxID=1232801 RepID=A0A6A4WRV8_AMPAM|nr:hypothetical protein FJT64_020719 [Amphibalanus amphitrite]